MLSSFSNPPDYLILVSTVGLTIFTSIFLLAYLNRGISHQRTSFTTGDIPESARQLAETLAAALPHCVILPRDGDAFQQARGYYWDQQESERVPSCIVRPQTLDQLSEAVRILKCAYDERVKETSEGIVGKEQGGDKGLFAVRSGGHSPVSGAASINGGVVIDLSLFNQIELSDNDSIVDIGPGCRWADVSKVLDAKGKAIVGGRNSKVGVGGLLLGGKKCLILFARRDWAVCGSFEAPTNIYLGGISFFSPRFGFASNNVISYQIVLADGFITEASSLRNPDLWRALKGGANNFGIVTRFRMRCFPYTKVWSGFLYLPSFQATKVLAGVHEMIARDPYDENAAGPLACFTYVQKLGIQVISINLVYTKLDEAENGWPPWFRSSCFQRLFRFWSTCRPRTLTSATDELHWLNTKNGREVHNTTTFKNDPATIAEAYASYVHGITNICHVKGIYWTLVMQPLLPVWIRKGDHNPMGLQDCSDAPLILLSFNVSWPRSQDDKFVEGIVRQCIERIDAFAESHGTGYPYRFLNYCGEWQKPFEGYGKAGLRFLQETSVEYDPDGLFQEGCVGGFKLGMNSSKSKTQYFSSI